MNPGPVPPDGDRQAQADAMAQEMARQFVNRAVVHRLGMLARSWEEEDRQARGLAWRIGIGALAGTATLVLLSVFFQSHPKIQLFIVSLGVGLLVAAGLIVRSRRRKRA
ncbi:MAG TPA: hypothetical protein VHA15_14400 [Burkholderiales bacterium]|jgi:hypothetical protein|nr:hypothetical protein [Burkholderiales bacterium]